MTKLAELAIAAACGTVLSAALIHAPLASADPEFSSDEDQFISDLNAAGMLNEHGPKAAIQGGWAICDDMSNGSSRQHEAIQLAQASASTSSNPGDTDLSMSEAERFVSIAMTDLCPQN